MTKKRFTQIMREYDFTDEQIEVVWDGRLADFPDEEGVHEVAKGLAPYKDDLL